MEDLIKKAQNFKEQSLTSVQELSIGKDFIPTASCATEGNPYVLFRCTQKVYDNRSNVIPTQLPAKQDIVDRIKAFNE